MSRHRAKPERTKSGKILLSGKCPFVWTKKSKLFLFVHVVNALGIFFILFSVQSALDFLSQYFLSNRSTGAWYLFQKYFTTL